MLEKSGMATLLSFGKKPLIILLQKLNLQPNGSKLLYSYRIAC